MRPSRYKNHGTWPSVPRIAMWSWTPLIAGCVIPVARLLNSFPNPTLPMMSKLRNMDQALASIGWLKFFSICEAKSFALALIRGS